MVELTLSVRQRLTGKYSPQIKTVDYLNIRHFQRFSKKNTWKQLTRTHLADGTVECAGCERNGVRDLTELPIVQVFWIKGIQIDGCLHPQRQLIILARDVSLI
jgi:hypothetical protein